MEEKSSEENEKITKKLIQIFEKESDAAKKEDADENKSEATATADLGSGQAGPSSRSSSPEPNCAICLESLQNKSFTDSCFHTFCFTCLVEWSKVKPECPLCKQKFKSIVHNVQKHERIGCLEKFDLTFEEYHITSQPMVNSVRYRALRGNIPSHLFNPQAQMQEVMRMHRMQFAPHTVITSPSSSSSGSSAIPGIRPGSYEFRRRVYSEGLWVKRPFMRQIRAASPDFFARNPACLHRLMPWLHRELEAILGPFRRGDARRLMNLVLAELQHYRIDSPQFAEVVRPDLGPHTSHFLYELQSFAQSPRSMESYDQVAEYSFLPSTHPSQHLIIPPLYPERAVDMSIRPPRPKRSEGRWDTEAPSTSGRVPSDDDECQVVGVVPPRSERTPEVVELSSDEEVVIDVSSDGERAPVHPGSPYPYSFHETNYSSLFSRPRSPPSAPTPPAPVPVFSPPYYSPRSPAYSPPSLRRHSSDSSSPSYPLYSLFGLNHHPGYAPRPPSSDSDVECVYQGKTEPARSPSPSTSRRDAAPERPRLASAVVLPPKRKSKHWSRPPSDSDESNTSDCDEKYRRVKKLRLNRVAPAPASSHHRGETSRDSSSHHSSYKFTVAFKKHKKKKHKERKKHARKHKRRSPPETDSD